MSTSACPIKKKSPLSQHCCKDERIYSIADKAVQKTFRTFGIPAAVSGATLVALSKGSSSSLLHIGLTLTYSACALALIHCIFYTYYDGKFGGKE